MKRERSRFEWHLLGRLWVRELVVEQAAALRYSLGVGVLTGEAHTLVARMDASPLMDDVRHLAEVASGAVEWSPDEARRALDACSRILKVAFGSAGWSGFVDVPPRRWNATPFGELYWTVRLWAEPGAYAHVTDELAPPELTERQRRRRRERIYARLHSGLLAEGYDPRTGRVMVRVKGLADV